MANSVPTTASRKRSWLRKTLFRSVGLAIGILIAMAIAEGLCTAYAWLTYRTVSVAELNEFDTGNIYTTEADQQRQIGVKAFYPHPWLGWVHGSGLHEVRSDWTVNNVGLAGPDFPLRHDPSKFTVLLTGGSVAEQLGMAGDEHGRYLETLLNEKYRFDRPVTVLVGANGCWMQPQQSIMLMLNADVVDAVISLDGFNENRSSMHGGNIRMEKPSQLFLDINPIVEKGPERVAAAYEAGRLKAFALEHPWRSVYFATRYLRGRLEDVSARKGRTQLDSMYLLPKEWSNEECIEHNTGQYKKYLRLMRASAREYGLKELHFIQPCPAIGKTLTDGERQLVGNLDYADAYRQMTDRLLALNDEGVPVESLLNCFENVVEPVYGDPIHCSPRTPGYRIMAELIAERVALAWNVPRREIDAANRAPVN